MTGAGERTCHAVLVGWDLKVGEVVVRKRLHDERGGQRQGGISTPLGSAEIFVFTDPSTGEQHGYFDEWVGEELHYCGEGQAHRGDQTMTGGNRAVLNHKAAGKHIRVFYGSKGIVSYAGEFTLADDGAPSWYFLGVDSPFGGIRKVIRFRLVPLGLLDHVEPTRTRPLVVPPGPLATQYRPAETTASESRQPFEVDPDVIDRALLGHARTQNALAAFATAMGCVTYSPGLGDPYFDLAWRTPYGSVVVVEVKSLTDGNEVGQIRLGLGQVLDYAHELREAEPSVRAVLAVEREPLSPRWVRVCADSGVTLVWPEMFDTLF